MVNALAVLHHIFLYKRVAIVHYWVWDNALYKNLLNCRLDTCRIIHVLPFCLPTRVPGFSKLYFLSAAISLGNTTVLPYFLWIFFFLPSSNAQPVVTIEYVKVWWFFFVISLSEDIACFGSSNFSVYISKANDFEISASVPHKNIFSISEVCWSS
jgi:hypothetical protein